MSLRTKLELAGIALLAAIFILGAWEFARYQVRKATAVATEAANKNANAIIQQHDAKAKADRDAEVGRLQAQLDAVNKRLDATKTPQDLAPVVAALMKLKQPITFVTPPATPENPKPAPVAEISTADTPQVKAYVQACETCKIQLQSAAANLKYAESQHADDLQKIKLAQDDAAKWKKAAEGGSWFDRMKHDGKIGLIGGGITVAVICALGHCPK